VFILRDGRAAPETNIFGVRRIIMCKFKYNGRYYDLCYRMCCVVAYSAQKGQYHFTWSNGQDRFLSIQKTGGFLKRYFIKIV